MNMRELRRWIERNKTVPDDAEILGTLPEFPIHWARGNPEYTNKLLWLEAQWDPEEEQERSPAMDKRTKAAADRLEELLPELREMINRLRHGCPAPYAEVYAFRKEINAVVGKMGAGVPSAHDRVRCQSRHGNAPEYKSE